MEYQAKSKHNFFQFDTTFSNTFKSSGIRNNNGPSIEPCVLHIDFGPGDDFTRKIFPLQLPSEKWYGNVMVPLSSPPQDVQGGDLEGGAGAGWAPRGAGHVGPRLGQHGPRRHRGERALLHPLQVGWKQDFELSHFAFYRVTIHNGKNLLLTYIRDVLPSCLSRR